MERAAPGDDSDDAQQGRTTCRECNTVVELAAESEDIDALEAAVQAAVQAALQAAVEQ